HLRAKLGEEFRDQEHNWGVRIRLQLARGFPEGKHEEFLFIDTDDSIYAHLKIPITVIRPSAHRLSATPAEVVLTAGRGQPFPARLLLVRDSKDEPVVIDEIQADHPAIRCNWTAGPGHAATVRVQVDRSALPPGQVRTAIHVRVSGPVAE